MTNIRMLIRLDEHGGIVRVDPGFERQFNGRVEFKLRINWRNYQLDIPGMHSINRQYGDSPRYGRFELIPNEGGTFEVDIEHSKMVVKACRGTRHFKHTIGPTFSRFQCS